MSKSAGTLGERRYTVHLLIFVVARGIDKAGVCVWDFVLLSFMLHLLRLMGITVLHLDTVDTCKKRAYKHLKIFYVDDVRQLNLGL